MHPPFSLAPLPTHHPPRWGSTQSVVSHALALKVLSATLPISSPAPSVLWFSSGLSFAVTAERPPLASPVALQPCQPSNPTPRSYRASCISRRLPSHPSPPTYHDGFFSRARNHVPCRLYSHPCRCCCRSFLDAPGKRSGGNSNR